ncbi:cation diffusion facilitator family transporter [Chloroflexota bacterium]
MSANKNKAAAIALAVVMGLLAIKVLVAAVGGSLSILAQAADSFLDIFAVTISLFSLRIAAKPADDDHHFGHGKVEGLAAIIQATLIVLTSGLIVFAAVQRFTAGATVELTEAGILVMAVSIVASIALSRYLMRVARETDSLSLLANARNISADAYSAGAVMLGLVALRLTGLAVIDPILAIGVALYILRTAYTIIRSALDQLIDAKLPDEEEAIIKAAITEHKQEIVGFHRLRTRKAGDERQIDLHIVMPRHVVLEEVHRFCDHLEQEIQVNLGRSHLTIHCEPCKTTCHACEVICSIRSDKP